MDVNGHSEESSPCKALAYSFHLGTSNGPAHRAIRQRPKHIADVSILTCDFRNVAVSMGKRKAGADQADAVPHDRKKADKQGNDKVRKRDSKQLGLPGAGSEAAADSSSGESLPDCTGLSSCPDMSVPCA